MPMHATTINDNNTNTTSIKGAVDTVTLAKFIEDEDLCAICFDHQRDIVFLPCKHFCVCWECGKRVDKCLMCRAEVEKKLLVES